MSNTSLPAQSANTFQSITMCNEFKREGINIIYLFPKLTPLKDKEILNIEKLINSKINFEFKNIFSIQLTFLKRINEKLWFLIKNTTFRFGLFFFLIRNSKVNIYSRDLGSLRMIIFLKRLPFFKIKLFFELHQYKRRHVTSLKQCDKLIVINNNLKKVISQNLNKEILIAHDGVNLEEFTALDFKNNLNKSLNILYTGSFFKWKGVDIIIKAAKICNDSQFKLIGGDENQINRLNQLITEYKLNNVELILKIDRKRLLRYIKDADILLLPNTDDKINKWTSPIKLFEYMASKRIIISSKIDSLQEIIDENSAVFFFPNSHEDLAAKITYLSKNYDVRMVKNAFDNVKKYSWNQRAKNIKSFLGEYSSI